MEFNAAWLFAAETPAGLPTAVKLLIVVAALVLPFIGGVALAQALRMREHGWKIGLILSCVLSSVLMLGSIWNPATGRFDFKLGVDLQGGVILIYEVEQSVKFTDDVSTKRATSQQPTQSEASDFSMSALIEALSRRINPAGTKEIVIRPYGPRQVEIIIPEVDQREVDQIKKVISTAGVLQFRIVANLRDHKDVIDLAREAAQDPVKKRSKFVYESGNQNHVGLWARVGRESKEIGGVRPFKVAVGDYTVRDAVSGQLLDVPSDVANNIADRDDDDRRLRLARWVADLGMKEIDVLMATNDGLNVNGSHLGGVMKSVDELMNPDILFSLKGVGPGLFGELTGKFSPDGQFHRQLGIVLDNELLSAPNIQERITDRGRITGKFTDEEVQFLVNILQAGSLPVVLNKTPISASLISPLLGQETIEQGKGAMVLGTVLVFLFMLAYYRFSGFLACVALTLNILFTLAIIVLIKAPLTLPGLAGLVLTVGMSVDANVLIYERMREEVARGAALRMVIRNGFSRAATAIIDSNLTTVITALILYAIGTDQLRGFAVTLTLGIVTSMFTAIFCSRVFFDIAERTRTITTLKMMQFLGATNIDFVGYRHMAVIGSSVLILLGVVATFVRGEDVLDIDFTGGSSVHVQLQKPVEVDQVRKVLEGKFPAGVPFSITGMSMTPGATANDLFKVDAKISEVAELEKIIQDSFHNAPGEIKLATYSLKYSGLKEVVVASPKKEEPKTEPAKTEPAKTEPAKTEPAKTEPAKTEPAKTEPAKTEPAKTEPAKTEPAKTEPAKTEPAKADESKGADAKSEAAKPAGNEGASSPLPPDNVLALAQDATPEKKADEKPADPKPAEEPKAEEKKAEEPKVSETKPEEKKDAEPKKEEAPKAEPAAAPAEKPAEKPESAPAEASPAPAGPATQAEAELEFGYPINAETLRAEVEQAAEALKIPLSYVDPSNPNWDGGSNSFEKWTLRLGTSQESAKKILDRLQEKFADQPVWPSSNNVGPTVAGRMQTTAIVALVASWIGIIIYVWIRFQNFVFGLAAVVALVHDVLVTVTALVVSHWLAGAFGFLLIEDFKISLTIVAALLTIIGYSINDTIVIFDRLREIRGKSPNLTSKMVNLGVNQTLSRTLLTFFTTFITVVVLYAFGGSGIHGFAFAMVIGMLTGTYSTVFVATPFILWLAGQSIEKE